MAFTKTIGGEDFEIETIPPYTEDEVKKLIDDGKTINEHHPKRVIRDRKTDEEYAGFKIVPRP